MACAAVAANTEVEEAPHLDHVDAELGIEALAAGGENREAAGGPARLAAAIAVAAGAS